MNVMLLADFRRIKVVARSLVGYLEAVVRLVPRHASLYLLWLVAASGAYAADTLTPYPAGFSADPSSAPVSLVGDRLAIGLVQNDPPDQNSYVMQVRLTVPIATVLTLIPGRVDAVEVAPDASRVLVHSWGVGSADVLTVTMISANGAILWTQQQNRGFGFSTTGQALYSQGPIGGRFFGRTVMTHSLSGTVLRNVTINSSTSSTAVPADINDLRGAVLVGDGGSVVLITQRQIRRVATGTPPTSLWVRTLTESYLPEFTGVHAFDSNRVIAQQANGGFQLIRVADGSVEYVFDPAVMAVSTDHPGKTRDEWAAYNLFADATANSAVLFDGKTSGYTLDLTTGTLTERSFDVSASPGSVVVPKFEAGRIVILGPTQVRVRKILQVVE